MTVEHSIEHDPYHSFGNAVQQVLRIELAPARRRSSAGMNGMVTWRVVGYKILNPVFIAHGLVNKHLQGIWIGFGPRIEVLILLFDAIWQFAKAFHEKVKVKSLNVAY